MYLNKENKQELLNILKDLVSYKSVYEKNKEYPFGIENKKCLDKVLEYGNKYNMKTKNLDNYCGYIEIGKGNKTIGVVTHTDVVPEGEGWNTDPYTLTKLDNKLYGRGTSDDKGATSAALIALKIIKERNIELNKKIRLIIGCNEETESKCIKYYLEKEGNFNYGFTPDGNFPLINGEKGIIIGNIKETSENIIKIEKIKNEYQLSSYFNEYMKKEDMYIENIDDWEDIGTLENYMKANKNNFNCRAFNNLYLDDFGVLCKKSKYSKVTSEMNWFKNIENTGFETLSPKFYESYKSDDEYGVEFYDYLTLSEYFTYYPLKDENRKYIFKMLLNKLIPIYKTKVSSNIDFEKLLLEMLITKTRNRLNKWNRKDLINSKYININGKTYKGISNLLNELDTYIKDICRSSNNYISIIHGDPAFSNILFSPRNMLFKFIDPRGNFGIDTVYGDYRYDIAKLRHCYHGRYDEIVNDLYVVNESKENDIFNISLKYYKNVDYSIYDEIILEHNLNLDDIELIEGLLFISMIPLHDDYPKRQIAFFARGIEILNNQLKRREKVC